MTIGLLVDPYGEKSPGGLGRAIFEMAKALIAFDADDAFTVFVKESPSETPKLPGANWRLKILGGKSLFLGGARNMDRTLDAYVFFNPIIPLFFFPKLSVVVVHDFAYLELPERTLRQKINALVLFYAHALSLWKATKIVAVSETAKRSAMRHFGISAGKIEVIYNGFVANESAEQPMPAPERFFLFAGVLKERKNVIGVIRAFAEFAKNTPGYSLLIAGKKEGTYYEECQALVRQVGLQDSVQFLGYVTNEQLQYLYGKAVALVFPSFIEGFGMPVLEAMHTGLPVITSNDGALAEVANDAARLVDPKNPSDIAQGMSDVALHAGYRAELVQKGKARAGQFSWEKNAEALHRLIVLVKANH